jgi:SAM-dependent methyltransferase
MTDVFGLADLCTPWCVRAAVTLGIAEQLADGARTVADLAERVDADPGALTLVLRQLAAKGVFTESAEGTFALNAAALPLLDPALKLGMGLDGIGGRMARGWSTMLTAVRTGEPAYAELFGRPFWADLDAHPEVAASFDELMGPGHGTPDPEVLPDSDWDEVHTVVDVGGGTGSLLAAILAARPHVTGTLVEVPRVAGAAVEVFAAAGVADRARVQVQSFFDPLPDGADVYLLSKVLGDWPDPEAEAILRRCAEAAGEGGRVVIVGGAGEGPPNPEAGLLMLVLVGGTERSRGELHELVSRAGLDVTRTGPRSTECRPSGQGTRA